MDSERVVHREESFDRPPTLVATDPQTRERVELERVDGDIPDDLTVERRTVESTDGATVPLFLCYRGDLSDDDERPTILHGYGGFRSSRTPSFDRFRVPFLSDCGVFAQVCARGGQEYGEPWHEAGMGDRKQHTFDDFLAAARYLCDAEVTAPDRLAVTGRSNGGLSVGAVLTQAPDLFGAAVCDVPLLDMLRYHEFGMGSAWTSEYGDPDDPAAFETLRAYSPYHNVDTG
ncbi:MAG: prolyl oligopeptidase family serine peptidase, partial [Halobaculum sp.]